MDKIRRILKVYNLVVYITGVTAIISFILSIPGLASPFLIGLFTTLGGAIPLLLAIIFFHYMPIKRQGLASIPSLNDRQRFAEERLEGRKKLMKTRFGTEDFVTASSSLINGTDVNTPMQELLLDYQTQIDDIQMQIFGIQLEILYKEVYSFDKYIYDIFHRKFFGLSEYEKYWNYSNKSSRE